MSVEEASAGVLRLTVGTALLVVTPLTIFLRHHGYVLYRPEILVLLLAVIVLAIGLALLASRGPLAAAAVYSSLIVAFIDVQFDFEVPLPGVGKTTVLVALFVALAVLLHKGTPRVRNLIDLMTGAALITTFLIPAGRLTWEESRPAPAQNSLPAVLHLILDEQAGLDALAALPGTLRNDVERFFRLKGFQIYGGAYSEHGETDRAIGHALSLASNQKIDTLVESSSAPFKSRLRTNRYFDWLVRQGYAIHVYQSDHLDLCRSVDVASCWTYSIRRLRVLGDAPLSPLEKARVIAGHYLLRSDAWNELRDRYAVGRRQLSEPAWLPAWNWERNRLSPVATTLAFERLEHDLRELQRGHAVIAHVLLPHYPYIYDAACEMRDPAEWLERHEVPGTGTVNNSAKGRALRYQRYGEQMQCTMRWIERLMSALRSDVREDAIVVVHGDHGSRITLTDPWTRDSSRLVDADYRDTYSTLFAVRTAIPPASQDDRAASVGCLLQGLVANSLRTVGSIESCSEPPPWARRGGQ